MAKSQPSQPVVSAPVVQAAPTPAERYAEQLRLDPVKRADRTQALKAHEDSKAKAAVKAAREKIDAKKKAEFEATRDAIVKKADESKTKKGPPKSVRRTMIPEMIAHRAHQRAQAAAAEAEAKADEAELESLDEATQRDAAANTSVAEQVVEPESAEGLSEELATRAKAAGFSDADLEGMDADLLGKALEVIERSAPKEHEPVAKKKPVDAEFTIKLDPELHDPEVVSAFKALSDQLVATRDELAEIREDTTRQRQNTAIDSLGAEWAEVFKVSANRAKVIEHVKVLTAGYEALGKKSPSEDALLREAAQAKFGDQKAKVAKRKADDKLRDRQGQFIGGNPQIHTTPTTGRSAGLGVVATWRANLAAKDYAAS